MVDDPPSGAGKPAHRQGSGSKKNVRELAEKFALPVALVLLPIIFQLMAGFLRLNPGPGAGQPIRLRGGVLQSPAAALDDQNEAPLVFEAAQAAS